MNSVVNPEQNEIRIFLDVLPQLTFNINFMGVDFDQPFKLVQFSVFGHETQHGKTTLITEFLLESLD